MSNMSYCRFENTARDLDDCIEAIENNEIHSLSDTEIDGLRAIQNLARCLNELKDDIEAGIYCSQRDNGDE